MLLELFKITQPFNVVLFFRVTKKKKMKFTVGQESKPYFPCGVWVVSQLAFLFWDRKESQGSQWFYCHYLMRPSGHFYDQQICTGLCTVPGMEDAMMSKTGKISILWELLFQKSPQTVGIFFSPFTLGDYNYYISLL